MADKKKAANVLRACPAAIYIGNERALSDIVTRVAARRVLKKSEAEVAVVRVGRYRCNTDQAVLYNHSINDHLKADLVEVVYATPESMTEQEMALAGVGKEHTLDDLRQLCLDEDLNDGSPLTLFVCTNLRGKAVDEKVDQLKFNARLGSSPKE